MEQDTSEQLIYLLHERVGDTITALESEHLITQLNERDLISRDEAGIMKAAVCDTCFTLPVPATLKDALRARILKSMLLEVARKSKLSVD